jgi:hypothetical protein
MLRSKARGMCNQISAVEVWRQDYFTGVTAHAVEFWQTGWMYARMRATRWIELMAADFSGLVSGYRDHTVI